MINRHDQVLRRETALPSFLNKDSAVTGHTRRAIQQRDCRSHQQRPSSAGDPQSSQIPTTRLASEAVTARFEQVFVDVGDRFPTVGPPDKDTLGIP